MDIITTQLPHCDLVKVTGRVDSLTAPKFAETIKSITNAGRYNLVIDLGAVSYTSSAGLRVLIDTQKTCRKDKRGELLLACIPQRLYETLDLAGFVPLFRLFEDVDEAVACFG